MAKESIIYQKIIFQHKIDLETTPQISAESGMETTRLLDAIRPR